MPTTLPPAPSLSGQPGAVPGALPGENRRLRALRSRWGWFVALGVALVVLGAVALLNTLVATVASVLAVASLMLVGAAFQIIHALGVRTWSSFFWWLGAGVIYALGGVAALFNPLLASAILTLMLAGFLVFGGVLRLMAAFKAKTDANWGWIAFSGLLSLGAGLLIALGWPTSSLFVLGTFLAVDLLMQGFAAIAFGLALRKRGDTQPVSMRRSRPKRVTG